MELKEFVAEIRHAKAMHRKYNENLVKGLACDKGDTQDFYMKQAVEYQTERNKTEDKLTRALFDANGDAIIGLRDFIENYIRK